MNKKLGLVARKIGMTRMVDPDGQMIPVTLLQVEPQKVVKLLTEERDGYTAVQIGYYEKPERLLSRPDLHRLRKSQIDKNFARFKEFRLDKPAEGVEIGAEMNIESLDGITAVDVTGITKGRGFQGSVKRWKTKCGRMSHGSRYHRRPGSLGTRTTPGRVFKGKPVPGHFGCAQRTLLNLTVLDLDKKNNVVALKGSVPGHNEGFVILKPSLKLKTKKHNG